MTATVASIIADLSIGVSTPRIHLGALQVNPECRRGLKKDFWFVRAGNSSQPLGRGQVPSNLPPHLPPPIPNTFPPVDHAEGEDENQPHNSAHNSASTTNQDLLARNNPGDPLINLLNPAPQLPTPQQNPEPVQHAPALSESQGQSHVAPAQQPLHDDVTRRLDSLEKLVAEQRGAPPPHHAADSIPHPLNTNITLEPYPAGFRIPQLETYDGMKDPDDHLHAFYSCMQVQNASDALMCKIFPSTLRGNARTYRRLIRKTTSELMRVKQRDGESLKNYMSRFNDAVLEVNSFDQAVGITAVISGLNHERFRDSLLKHPATTFSENQNLDWRDENPSRKRMRTAQNRGPMSTSTPRFGRPNSAPPQQSAGGLEAGGMSSKQRKLYVREVKHQNRAQKRKLDDADWKDQPITFTTADFKGVVTPHNDPLVISVMINNCQVQRVLVDTGSAPDIMYYHCFESLGLDLALLQRYDGPIYGFNNQPVSVEGKNKDQPAENPPSEIHDSRQVMGVEILDNRPEDETRATPGEDVEEQMANGKWRMCIDYTNLNQACLKDCYQIPNIDKLVEAASGNERLSLLDAYSSYHQVPMAHEDEEKTSFYASDEIYCYVMMPFSLKNAVVKSLKAENHLTDLEETFNNLRKNRMRLNLAKCIFGVESGKFLGFMVSRRGIEVNPEKIKAVAEMESPKSIKDPRRMNLANRRSFEWNSKCQAAFDELKSYLSSPPLRTKADDGEILYLYLGISDEAISSVLQRSAIRAQALADFIVECTSAHSDFQPELDSWILYVDGASSSKGSRAGAILLGLEGYRSEHALKFNFDATNNMAEYEALLLGLQLAIELKVTARQAYSDLQLVVNQVNSVCEVIDPVMMKSVFVEILDEPSFLKPRMMEISTDSSTPSWTDPIISFLRDGTVPADKQEEMRLRKKASLYTLVNDVLYKRSFSLPLLRCLNPYEAEYAFREVHEGVCGSHTGARTLAHKFNSVYHPESNGMVESVNKVILEAIKPRLELHKAKWADELNNVLWAYRTTSRTTTSETPYHLAVGTKAVIAIEIGVPSFKVTHFNEGRNGQLLRENLDLLDEVREEARLRTLLAPNWEGPYIVAEVLHPGAYILRDTEGKRVPRVWNVNNLKKFYP
ncbi:hypothetical protein SLEP1_g55455 [Rubroshorea leprosula]|uniref:Uncharacterized protein n=1 Tax=Rubroshorea leprosula TaxID=152421 RepID=A0AAV5MHY3_9ROSI|nr:hypothetical protein SLEP1_g55455 [Rubroshorea leprosula]